MPFEFLQYLFVEQLGRGGMGAVFRAYDKRAPERPWVAVKVAQLHGTDEDRAAKERAFAREVRAAAALSEYGKYFVGFRAADFNGKPAYLALDFIDWPTLQKLRAQFGTLPPVDVARMGAAILRGVRWMERKSIVHRDLKPANIFARRATDGTFEAKIADLGIWVEAGTTEDSLLNVTDAPHIVGSPPYMSPEQSRGGALTVASDIHAVGSILWELATGAPPYPINRALSLNEALRERHERMRTPPPRPSNMHPEFYWLLSAALHFEPGKRVFTDADVSHSPETSIAKWMEKALDKFASDYIEQQQKALAAALDHLAALDRTIAASEARLTPAILLADRALKLRTRINSLRADTVESNLPDAVKALSTEVESMAQEAVRLLENGEVRPALARAQDTTPERLSAKQSPPPIPAEVPDAPAQPAPSSSRLRHQDVRRPTDLRLLGIALSIGLLAGFGGAYLSIGLRMKPPINPPVAEPDGKLGPTSSSSGTLPPAATPMFTSTITTTSSESQTTSTTAVASAQIELDAGLDPEVPVTGRATPSATTHRPGQTEKPSNNCGCTIGDIMCAGRCYEQLQKTGKPSDDDDVYAPNPKPKPNPDVYE